MYLKIESELAHPSSLHSHPGLIACPLKFLLTIINCMLLPLFIQPKGRSPLFWKLQNGGLLIVFHQTKTVRKHKHWMFGLTSWGLGWKMLLLCHQFGVPLGSILRPHFVLFFFFLSGNCVHVRAPRLLSGRSWELM